MTDWLDDESVEVTEVDWERLRLLAYLHKVTPPLPHKCIREYKPGLLRTFAVGEKWTCPTCSRVWTRISDGLKVWES